MKLNPTPYADLRILALQADETACGHYRIRYPMEFLRRGGAQVTIALQGFSRSDLEAADIIIAQRQYNEELLEVLQGLQARGRTVIYELDDNLHAVHPNSPSYRTYHQGTRELRMVTRYLRSADGLTLSTGELAHAYRDMNPNIRVVRNYLDLDLRDWKTREPRRAEAEGKVVLFWAGGSTHLDDLRTLGRSVARVLDRYPQAVFGVCTSKDLIQQIVYDLDLNPDRMIFYEPVPFVQYPSRLTHGDIGLAPIARTPFNQAKSDLRLLEMGAQGMPYVASRVAPYQFWCQQGRDGFTVGDEDEWVDRLSYLIENEEARRAMGAYARERVYAERNLTDHVYQWADALRDLREQARAGSRKPAADPVPRGIKVGRNDPCPCGSGYKYKKCPRGCFGAW